MASVKRVINRVLDLLFPPKCAACGARTASCDALCQHCLELFEKECSEVSSSSESRKIPDICLTYYKGRDTRSERVTEKLIYSVKHRHIRSLTDFFARDLSARILRFLTLRGIDPSVCMVTYSPRSERGIKKYGFDQALELSKRVSHYTGIPHATVFVRCGGLEQKTLTAAERKDNSIRSLHLSGIPVHGRQVIIIDDVTTSGSTLSYASQLLKSSGAVGTVTAVIAHTKKHERTENP